MATITNNADVIEWTGIGTVATNISNEDDWTYKLNMDWNTQYVEINNIVAYSEAFSYGADVLYMNNEYNFTTGETFYIDDTETLVINGDLTEFYSFKFSIKISKNDGLVFTSNLDDNTYEIKNYHLIENSPVLYLSSLVRTSGNSYSTIGEIKVVALEETGEDVIEWTGIGTVATGLRAHDVEHNNYKINIDWNTQCFDIIVTEDFNYLSSVTKINIANLDKIIIGNNIYEPEIYVNNNSIDITIYYGSVDETSNYNIERNHLYNIRLANIIERNYPYTIRFTKEGVYIVYGSTSNLIMERDYDLDTIYFNEDGLDNEPLSGNENGDYDVAFDLAVSEYSGQIEEPEEDVIEWTGTGTVATGLNSGIKHSNYKINLDWDNENFDIILQNYTQTGNGVADTKVCSVRINNNTYDYYFSEGRIVLRQGSIDICECSSYVLPSTLRFAKDGVYCLYEEENVKIGEIEYGDDNVIYILEDDEYSTDFSMNFNLAVSERSSEDIEPEIKQLSLGNLKIDKLYIGETEVTEIYLGEVLVYKNKSTF